ncbi:MAG TPA: dockerin, partial [Phycisphaerae bacterium]|nr:dockerin [Phycisphaerae bacterium]
DGMTIEGKEIRLRFQYADSGLMAGKKEGLRPVFEDKAGVLRRFAIAGKDRKWHWADARIDGKTVVVSHKDVSQPVAVRYAYAWNPLGANLYNREGLPSVPFRTDDW